MVLNLSAVLSESHKPLDETVALSQEWFCLNGIKYPIVSKDDVHITVKYCEDSILEIGVECYLIVEIPCDRCLQPVHKDFPLCFIKKVKAVVSDSDVAGSDELDESNYIDGYTLDVDQLICNEILIGWPTKILCSEDCKGICNVCGQNLNQGACNCEDTSLDPRMSVIRDVFKNFKEV